MSRYDVNFLSESEVLDVASDIEKNYNVDLSGYDTDDIRYLLVHYLPNKYYYYNDPKDYRTALKKSPAEKYKSLHRVEDEMSDEKDFDKYINQKIKNKPLSLERNSMDESDEDMFLSNSNDSSEKIKEKYKPQIILNNNIKTDEYIKVPSIKRSKTPDIDESSSEESKSPRKSPIIARKKPTKKIIIKERSSEESESPRNSPIKNTVKKINIKENLSHKSESPKKKLRTAIKTPTKKINYEEILFQGEKLPIKYVRTITKKPTKKINYEGKLSQELKSPRRISRKQPIKKIDINKIPNVLKSKIALELPNEDLINLCQTNTEFAKICDENNSYFWKTKIQEFDKFYFPELPCGFNNWKELFIFMYACQDGNQKIIPKLSLLNEFIDRIGSIFVLAETTRHIYIYAVVINTKMNKNKNIIEIEYIPIITNADAHPKLHIGDFRRDTLFLHKTNKFKKGIWLSRNEYDKVKENLKQEGKRMNLNKLLIKIEPGYFIYHTLEDRVGPILLFDYKCSSLILGKEYELDIYDRIRPKKPLDMQKFFASTKVTNIKYEILYNIQRTFIYLNNGNIILGFYQNENTYYYYIDNLKVLESVNSLDTYINKYNYIVKFDQPIHYKQPYLRDKKSPVR